VDWPSLLTAIDACNPETVWVTHGYSAAVARYLTENGREARVLDGRGRIEGDEDAADAQESTLQGEVQP
jgi:putative mRNA 3-end processing factor